MLGDEFRAGVRAAVGADAVLARLRGIRFRGGVHARQAVEQPPQPLGQALVREIHVGEEGVAAVRWNLARDQERGHRGELEVRGVAVPDAAEVHAFVLQLLHFGDPRKPVEALQVRIVDRVAEAPGEGHELRGRERLVPEEEHEVLEPGTAQRGDLRVGERLREIDPANLGPERAGDAAHFDLARRHAYCSILMLALRMIVA